MGQEKGTKTCIEYNDTEKIKQGIYPEGSKQRAEQRCKNTADTVRGMKEGHARCTILAFNLNTLRVHADIR